MSISSRCLASDVCIHAGNLCTCGCLFACIRAPACEINQLVQLSERQQQVWHYGSLLFPGDVVIMKPYLVEKAAIWYHSYRLSNHVLTSEDDCRQLEHACVDMKAWYGSELQHACKMVIKTNDTEYFAEWGVLDIVIVIR